MTILCLSVICSNNNHLKLLSLILFLLLLNGCSEDASKIKADDGFNLNVPTKTNFLPYEILSFSASGSFSSAIGFVDSQNPTATRQASITSSGLKINILPPRFNRAVYNSTENTLSSVRLNTFLFSQNNKLYKINLLDVVEPVREQLSAEFQVDGICHEWDVWAEDYNDFGESRYIYYIANDCQSNDGEWHMVKLSMTEADPPANLIIDVNYFISGILNAENGSLDGWLAVSQNGFLIKYDVDFKQSTLVRSGARNIQVVSQSQYLIDNFQSQMLLAIDEKLVWYNPKTHLADNILEVFPSGQMSQIKQWRSDGKYLYFTVDHFANDGLNVLNSSLHRVLLINALQIENLSVSEIARIENLEVGTSGITYAVGGQLKHFSSENSSLTNIDSPANYALSLDAQGVPVFFVSGNTIVAEYMRVDSLANRQVNLVDMSQQTKEILENNYIVGAVYQKDRRFDFSRNVVKVVLESQNAGLASRVISALVPSEYPVMLKLGELPADSNPRPLNRFYALGHEDVLIQGPINSVVELFFINTEKADSLRRVTNNQTTERVIYF